MKNSYTEPVYPISIAAKFIKVCLTTLRIWEKKGLLKPKRIGKNRFYSRCDIDRLEQIKQLTQGEHINIEGVRHILNSTECWQIKKCRPEERKKCSVYRKYGPR